MTAMVSLRHSDISASGIVPDVDATRYYGHSFSPGEIRLHTWEADRRGSWPERRGWRDGAQHRRYNLTNRFSPGIVQEQQG
jgi:hypothetical protein